MKREVTPIASQASLTMAMHSPLRTRQVADMIRGQKIEVANRMLVLEKRKAARILLKILRSAMANAQQRGVADLDRLYISDLQVNEGPRVKRWFARAHGRADTRVKRSCHVQMQLSERRSPNMAKAASKAKKTTKKVAAE